MSFHAPQAYTKETLAKAFDWLQHQPAGVTQAATTPDNLVAIYLKAQRQGITTFDVDAPNSSRKFIDDLKSLKKEMAPFDDSPAQAPAMTREPLPVREREPQLEMRHRQSGLDMSRDLHREIAREMSQASNPAPTHTTNNTLNQSMNHTPVNVAVAVNMDSSHQSSQRGGLQLNMDSRSMEAINDIQQRFNLGSPQEAIRMLISVGHQQITRWP